ncbi:MAG: thiamine diphosphokinase [Lachnospiraceae bacterium]|nr:thiamine diphosphokinase [Lachnospiraceae bacterium]
MEQTNKTEKKRCILVCAGDFTPVEIEKQEGDLVIACDGGYDYCCMVGIQPDLIIGDFDSVSEHVKSQIESIAEEKLAEVITLPVEKDDTDTMAALRIGIERGYKDFRIYGALGGRVDHTMANFQSLVFLLDHGAKGYILSHDTMVTAVRNDTVKFHPGMEGIVSLFPLESEISHVTIRGLKYECEDLTITNGFPIGVSNSFIGREAEICIGNGTALVMVIWQL